MCMNMDMGLCITAKLQRIDKGNITYKLKQTSLSLTAMPLPFHLLYCKLYIAAARKLLQCAVVSLIYTLTARTSYYRYTFPEELKHAAQPQTKVHLTH